MNKELIINRFTRSRDTYEGTATVQRSIAETMIDLIRQNIHMQRPDILEVGCGTGVFSRMLIEKLNPSRMILNDICDMRRNLCDLLSEQVNFIIGDAEEYPFPGKYHIISSCSALQWFVHPEVFFERCHSMLYEDGYLAFSTFGAQNLKEVTAVTGDGLSYFTCQELEEMLQPNYELLYSQEEIIKLPFDSPLEVLYHLKHTGVTALKHQSWTRRDLTRFCDCYSQLFTVNSFVSLTYHPIYIIAHKKTKH